MFNSYKPLYNSKMWTGKSLVTIPKSIGWITPESQDYPALKLIEDENLSESFVFKVAKFNSVLETIEWAENLSNRF